jgi:nicotinamide-nucleotide amidase
VPGAEILTVLADPGAPEPALAGAVARLLGRRGVAVRGRRVLPPEEGPVVEAVRQAVAAAGTAVTLADGAGASVLRQATARVCETHLVLSERALEALGAAHAARGQALPGRAEALALLPRGAAVLVPAGGGEPGFVVEAGAGMVAGLPGDEAAALAVLGEHVLPRLLPARTGLAARTLRVVGGDAGSVEAGLAPPLPATPGVAVHASDLGEEVWVWLRARGETPAAAGVALRATEPALRAALGAAWYGDDEETLEAVTGRALRARGWTLAVAESCTGGLVGHRLTQVAGSSTYFERGFVVYSNAAKQALLGVPEAILRRHGAVSGECASAMAEGARAHAHTDLGLAVTGIAGPDGGTPAKPVGTVFVALAGGGAPVVERYRFARDRAGNKALSAARALDLVRRRCLGLV